MLDNSLAATISLDGAWQFKLGNESDWSEIMVPGCWEAQGHPMRLDGPAFYRKIIFIPTEWSGKNIHLQFDAVSYACTIFLNGSEVGSHRGMWTPFEFDITRSVLTNEENILELQVFKPGQQAGARYPFRSSLTGFIPDIATTFGGIWQPARIIAYDHAFDFHVSTDFDQREIITICHLAAVKEPDSSAEWIVNIHNPFESIIITTTIPYQTGQPLDQTFPIRPMYTWAPDHPQLYEVEIAFRDKNSLLAVKKTQVGFRQLSVRGDQLLLNGHPFMVRGILSWGWNPESITPYISTDTVEDLIKSKQMGFNCVKCCLFVPASRFLDFADRIGMLVWQEMPMWLPEVNDDLRQNAPLEYKEITRHCSPHPSVVLYSLGCEMNRSVDEDFLSRLDFAVRQQINGALLCENSGSGESYGGLDSDSADFTDYHPYYDLHYFEPLLNHWRRDWQPKRPWIFGEFSDSDTFRDLDEIIDGAGGQTPWWMTSQNPVTDWRSEARALLDEPKRLASLMLERSVGDLVRISYDQAYIIRKYTLETLRRRDSMGGYVITGLRDTPISTSGILDDFGRAKWLPDEFSMINGNDILCLDTDRRRTWRHGGDRPDHLEPLAFTSGSLARWHVIAHCSQESFPQGSQLEWTLTHSDGSVVLQDRRTIESIVPAGKPDRIATLAIQLPHTSTAEILLLSLRLSVGRREIKNCWDVWVYPRPETSLEDTVICDPTGTLFDWGEPLSSLQLVHPGSDLNSYHRLISTGLDGNILDWVTRGGQALLLQQGLSPLPARRCPFWREAIKLFENHPLWDSFPHKNFSGMQFFAIAGDLAFETKRLRTTLPANARINPILRRLDAREFHISEYILEVIIGKGRLLACSLALNGGEGIQPSGLRRNVAGAALLNAFLHIMRSH